MRRYSLRDDQWERIEGVLPGKSGDRGPTASINRLFVEAILYRYRAGIPWRDLPERFGGFRVVHISLSRRYPRGIENVSIFSTVRRLIPKSRAASRGLMPSTNTA